MWCPQIYNDMEKAPPHIRSIPLAPGAWFFPEHTAGKAASEASAVVLPLREYPPLRSICLLKRNDLPLYVAAGTLETMLLRYSTAI